MRAGSSSTSQRIGFWARWSDLVARRKVVARPSLATAVIVALAIPFFSMRLGHARPGQRPGRHHDPQGVRPDRAGLRRRLQLDTHLVVSGPQAQQTRPTCSTVSRHWRRARMSTRRSVHAESADQRRSRWCRSSRPRRRRTRRPPAGQEPASRRAAAVYEGTANHVYVYGQTAVYVDFAKVLVGQDAVVHRGRRRAVVPAADDRVPQPGHPAHGRGHEPVRRRRRRSALSWRSSSGAGAPRLLGIGKGGPIEAFAAGDVLRDPVRPVDGLPGVPGQPHARGVGAHQATTAARSRSVRPRPAASSPRRRSS